MSQDIVVLMSKKKEFLFTGSEHSNIQLALLPQVISQKLAQLWRL